MSGLAQYQSVFRISKPDAIKNSAQPCTSKRNRQCVSCSACRTRKLKCDRQVPCQSCVKRGDVASCSYSPNNAKNGRRKPEGSSRASEAQLRLQKLEEMVSSFIQKSKNGDSENSRGENATSLLSDSTVNKRFEELSVNTPSTTLPSRGHLDITGSEANYVGATHWTTVLENIRDIKGVLSLETDDVEEPPTAIQSCSFQDEPDIVFDTNAKMTLTDVCDSLPSRNVTDKLVSAYFNPNNARLPIIHSGKFFREYQSFWADPTSVPFLWISILFSILHMGSPLDQANNNTSEDPQHPPFLMIAGQALVTGKYQKARPYSVEAVILYATSKYFLDEDLDRDAWLIMGIAARLAIKMGYHRDPTHLLLSTRLSPFEGEMRRRTFFIIEIFDLLLSFQAGLPPIIHEEERDALPPRNLRDSDFDESSPALPPARSPTDYTPILYFAFKSTVATTFRRVIRHVLCLAPPVTSSTSTSTSTTTAHYATTLALDAEIRANHASTPPSLRASASATATNDDDDPPHMLLYRITLDMFFLKSLCVLHRTYISHERDNPSFAHSRATCTDAALRILAYQAALHAERAGADAAGPGEGMCVEKGKAERRKVRMSSLALHDYLLAAMVLALDLYEGRHDDDDDDDEEGEDQRGKGDRAQKFQAVTRSWEILQERRAYSRDARRASDVLAVMLAKVSAAAVSRKVAGAAAVVVVDDDEEITTRAAEGSVAMPSYGMGGGGNAQALELPADDYYYVPPDSNAGDDPLSSFFGESNDFNWGLVDQYLLDQSDLRDMF